MVQAPELRDCVYKLVHGNDNIQQSVAAKLLFELFEKWVLETEIFQKSDEKNLQCWNATPTSAMRVVQIQ